METRKFLLTTIRPRSKDAGSYLKGRDEEVRHIVRTLQDQGLRISVERDWSIKDGHRFAALYLEKYHG